MESKTYGNVILAGGVISFLYIFYNLVVVSCAILLVFGLPLIILRRIITFVFGGVAEKVNN